MVASVMAINLWLMPLFFNSADAWTVPSSTMAVQPTRINDAGFITEAARRFGIPARWICAVIQVESGSNPDAVSPKGALGLMQLMPTTYVAMRAEYHLGADPFAPGDNIIAGVAYLRMMYDRFGPDGFLAAYNCGPACYDEHLATGLPLPAETQIYVARLMPVIDGLQNTVISASNIGQDITISNGIFPAQNTLNGTRAPFFVVQSQYSQSAESLQPASKARASSRVDSLSADNGIKAVPAADFSALLPLNSRQLNADLDHDPLFVPVATTASE